MKMFIFFVVVVVQLSYENLRELLRKAKKKKKKKKRILHLDIKRIESYLTGFITVHVHCLLQHSTS